MEKARYRNERKGKQTAANMKKKENANEYVGAHDAAKMCISQQLCK